MCNAYEACKLVPERKNGIVNQKKVSLREGHWHENYLCNSLLVVKLAGYYTVPPANKVLWGIHV